MTIPASLLARAATGSAGDLRASTRRTSFFLEASRGSAGHRHRDNKYDGRLIGISYFTKKDAVAEWLRTEILSGNFSAGAPLLQHEIAQRLNVSPTPVREAFRELEAEGLIVSRPHRGVVVSERDYEDKKAVYEIRALIETHVMRHVARAISPTALKELTALVKQSEQALRTANLQLTRDANARFHEVLMTHAESHIYVDLAQSLISQSRYYLPLTRKRMLDVVKSHRAILLAVASHDADAAASLMQRHMSANLRWLYQVHSRSAVHRRPSSPVKGKARRA